MLTIKSFMRNEIPHRYQFEQSISVFNGCKVLFFIFNSNFNKKFCKQTVDTLILVSDLALHCLPMSHKKEAMCIWGKAPEQRYIRTWLSRVFIVRDYLGPDAKKERKKNSLRGFRKSEFQISLLSYRD